jgi:hypothetical protein
MNNWRTIKPDWGDSFREHQRNAEQIRARMADFIMEQKDQRVVNNRHAHNPKAIVSISGPPYAPERKIQTPLHPS